MPDSIDRQSSAAEPSRVLFESALAQVGEFRCPTSHPRFADSGPTKTYCFVFPRTAVWIQQEGSAAFVADPTLVPLYNPGHPYRRGRISRDGDRTDWFGVSGPALREALASYGSPGADAHRHLFPRSFSRATAPMFVRQRRVFEHVRSTPAPDALYVEESVLTLLDEVLAGIAGPRHRDPAVTDRHRAVAEDARAHLNVTYALREDLTGMATSLGVSVFHLCRIFKRQTGQTIHRYRSQLRLRKSLELLRDSDDILTIALALGYSGHSHFTSAFHALFGVTPSDYRRLPRQSGSAGSAKREQSADSDSGRN